MGSSRSRSLNLHSRHRAGVAAVWFAIIGLCLVGLFSLGVDYAHVWYTQHQLQIAADSAALTVAQSLAANRSQKDARQAAVDLLKTSNYVEHNPITLDDSDVVLGVYDFKSHKFNANTQSPNAAKVTARRTKNSVNGAVKLIFGAFWRTAFSDVSGTAIAVTGPATPPQIVVLEPSAGAALTLSEGASLSVSGGGIQVNSSANNAVMVLGTGSIDTTALNVVGQVLTIGSSINGTINTGAPSLPDPLSNLGVFKATDFPPAKTYSDAHGDSTNGTSVLSPGYYPNPMSYTGGRKVMLAQPGIYVFGSGLTITGTDTSLEAPSGAMIYVLDGGLTVTGTGGIKLTSLKDDPQYAGIGIYMDRNNTNSVTLTGDSGAEIGTIYAPSSAVHLTGKTSIAEIDISTLIVRTLALDGTTKVSVTTGGPSLNGLAAALVDWNP